MKEINYELRENYISNDEELCGMIKQLIADNQVILLVAPQGVGKTHFLEHIEGYEKLFSCPTVSTAEQVEQSTNACFTKGKTLNTFSIRGAVDRFGNPKTDVTSTTFGSVEGIVHNAYIDNYDILVIDEVHKLVQYSTFGYSNITATLDTIKAFIEHGKKVIFTTATDELLTCFNGISKFPSVDVRIQIKSNKKYIKKCEVISYATPAKILKLIKKNYNDGSFQIVLYNNKNVIKQIETLLKHQGIKAISVNGREYREDIEINNLINHKIKKGNYCDYSVLLATSWIDVGLNFEGDNISHIYCIFDNIYNNGDFTTIKQFMARARNSHPVLYINKPLKTVNESKLKDMINNIGYAQVYEKLSSIANELINNYSSGYIRNIKVDDYYGIYQYSQGEYMFSELTLNYQLYKIDEKYNVIENMDNLKELLNTDEILFNSGNDAELKDEEYIKLIEFIEELIETDNWCSVTDMCELLSKITNGRIVKQRPKQYIEKYLFEYCIEEKSRALNGKSTKGYKFKHI